MERTEVSKILNKIKAFRQSFEISNSLVLEWTKILEPYRYEDVDKKLDEYFKESSNFGQYPDAYYLTKYLKTEEELSKTQTVMARCSLCGKEMPYNDLEEHFDRCSSIDYVYRESRKHLHKTFDKQKLWEMDNQTFDRFYWKVCDELFKVMPRSLQRHCLENAILTHQGKEPKYSMEELQEMIDKQH